MNTDDKQNDILNEANEKKFKRLEQARANYAKRKEEGRLKTKRIPKEEQKKRGPKQTEQTQIEPKTRGRKPIIINEVSEIPIYINKLKTQSKHNKEYKPRLNRNILKLQEQTKEIPIF